MIKNSMYYMAILSSLPIVTLAISPVIGSICGKAKELLKSKEKKRIEEIQLNFCRVVRELKLVNSINQYPKDLQIKFISYGFELSFDIAGICSYKTIESNTDFIKDCFGAVQILTENSKGIVKLVIFMEDLEQQDYKKYILSPTQLFLGYNYHGTITTDMKISPHLLISGLSGQGKTGQLRVIVSNLIGISDIYLINCFKHDFKGFKGIEFVNGNEDILKFLEEFKQNEFKDHDRPIYLVFEELMTLSEDKKIQKLIKEFLCVCRHYNVFIIGLIQVCRAEDFKAKTFFNSRISFKQMDRSSYGVALGSMGEMEELNQREFYSKGSNGLEKGITYNLDY